MRDILPASLLRIAEAISVRGGGRAFVIGGAVRDYYFSRLHTEEFGGLTPKDFDLEVYGVDIETLQGILSDVGKVDAVGAAFQVLKVRTEDGTFDVSIPRVDSKSGDGHRGFTVVGDPHLSTAEAARRRDFTLNALSYDILTGSLQDPCGGMTDLMHRRLRVVDKHRFLDDALRILRAAQFSSRFSLSVDRETALLLMFSDISGLPSERVAEEFRKGLLKSREPGKFLRALHGFAILARIFPEVEDLYQTPQEPEFHPEVSTGIHTEMVMTVAGRLLRERPELSEAERLAVLLGALCHDLGKPLTTQVIGGRIRQLQHAQKGIEPATRFLDRLGIHTFEGFPLRQTVLNLVEDHLVPGEFGRRKGEVGDGAYRRLARKHGRLDLLYMLACADTLGRGVRGELPGRRLDGSYFDTTCEDYFMNRARELNVEAQPPAPPVLNGRHLMEHFGLEGGVRLGQIKAAVYEHQLEGHISNLEEALAYARTLL